MSTNLRLLGLAAPFALALAVGSSACSSTDSNNTSSTKKDSGAAQGDDDQGDDDDNGGSDGGKTDGGKTDGGGGGGTDGGGNHEGGGTGMDSGGGGDAASGSLGFGQPCTDTDQCMSGLTCANAMGMRCTIMCQNTGGQDQACVDIGGSGMCNNMGYCKP